MSIGPKLRARRQEMKIAVAEAAKRVGMAPSTLYDLERGEQVSSTKLAALCSLYGLNPDWVEFNRGPRLATAGKAAAVSVERDEEIQVHGMQTTPEEVELGIEWGKLGEPTRSIVREQIMMLVARQKREERAAKKRARPAGGGSGSTHNVTEERH